MGLFAMHFVVLGSDVIYSEEAVHHLVKTLLQLCGDKTTIFLSGELRNGESFILSLLLLITLYNKNTMSNILLDPFFFFWSDAVLEYFLESALKDFAIGRVEQTQWHPDYRSRRVVLYILEKKSKRCLPDDSSLNQSC